MIELEEQAGSSVIIAGAIQMCSMEPGHFACQPIEPPAQQITLSAADMRVLNDISRRIRFGRASAMVSDQNRPTGSSREQGNVDVWHQSASPDQGDCEDRMLWAWNFLRRNHPELASVARPVMFRPRGAGEAHIGLEINGTHVIDSNSRALNPITQYRNMRKYYPDPNSSRGVGGRWLLVPSATMREETFSSLRSRLNRL